MLIGETYLPDTRELDKWYGGERHDELKLPMDLLVGFLNTLDAGRFRRLLQELETDIHGSQPLLVFDNHDNVRSWDRYGDGTHDLAIARLIATLLLTSRGAALLYQGQEIGQLTATPSRVEDVRGPIGITGWPREKGRDGERTPMQWDRSNRQAGFSSNARTWLPVPASYDRISVAGELADPASLLGWYRRLIRLRHDAALREGRTVMLNPAHTTVLSYARISRQGRAVLVCLNMSPSPQTVSLDLSAVGLDTARITTRMASPRPFAAVGRSHTISLPPYGAWVATAR